MESTISLQKDLQKSIERALINFKKCPKERCTVAYKEAKLDILEKDWTLFRINNAKLYESYKASELENSVYVKNDIYANTEESYIEAVSYIKSLLKLGQTIQSGQTVNNSKSTNEGHSSSLAKLPKITIPTFSGKYDEWTTFKDLFVSLIHKSKSLDNVQKLHYLKGHLTGEAELLIRHTPIADSNYERCWELLESRYNNKRFLSNTILNKLFTQRSMKFESATAIKELIDITSDCLSALKALEVDVSTWDIIIIHIVGSKLDLETRKQWELSVSNASNIDSKSDLPTFSQFKSFLENRFRALEFIEPNKRSVVQHGSGSSCKSMVATSESMACEFCSDSHKLSFCKAFAKQDVSERRAFVSNNRMCFNCLGGNHNVYSCKKPTVCRICKRRHHSLLHLAAEEFNAKQPAIQEQPVSTTIEEKETPFTNNQVVSCHTTSDIPKTKQVLLATALIKAEAMTGEYPTLRALMDQGSQACFITEAAVQMLRLKKIPVNGTVSGLGNDNNIKARYLVQTTIQSRTDPQFKMEVRAYVLSNITSYLPEKRIESIDWVDIGAIQLADPQFASPRRIDMLLGADVYSQVLKQGMKKSASGNLVAQSTSLGWILSGGVVPKTTAQNEISVLHVACNESKNDLIKQYWKVEAAIRTKRVDEEAISTKRIDEEAVSTRKVTIEEEQQCEASFKATAKREAVRYEVKQSINNEEPQINYSISRGTELKEQYTEVNEKNNEYLSSNHMQPVKESGNKNNEAVYLPNHAVAKKDAIYKRIDWRDDPGIKMLNDELVTVTVRTVSTPYLAVQAIDQVTKYDEREVYKWNSSNRKLLKQKNTHENTEKYKIENKQNKEVEQKNENDRSNEYNKEMKLGKNIEKLDLTFDRSEDIFQCKMQLPPSSGPVTKKKNSIDIRRLFDPIGWIASTGILVKMMIQRLWLSFIERNKAVFRGLLQECRTYLAELQQPTIMKISRWLAM